MNTETEHTEPAGSVLEDVTPTSFSLDEAAASFADDDDAVANENESATPNAEEPQSEEVAVAAETTEDQATEGEEGDDTAAEAVIPEPKSETPEPLDFDALPGTAILRLRDGTEVTVGDIKKSWGELSDLNSSKQAFEADFRQKMSQFEQSAQEAQRLSQILPIAIEAARRDLPDVPPMPPASLLETDTMKYMHEKAMHDEGMAAWNQKAYELQELEAEQTRIAQEQDQRSAAEQRQFLAEQQQILIKAMPELADPAKGVAFQTELVAAGAHYNVPPEEVNSIKDARLVLALSDAGKWRKLQSNPPKPVAKPKPGATTPIKQPGRRMGEGERINSSQSALQARLRKSGGTLDEVAAAWDD